MKFAGDPVPGVGHVLQDEAVPIAPNLARESAAISGSFTAHFVGEHLSSLSHRQKVSPKAGAPL
jgi:hypothetical protein